MKNLAKALPAYRFKAVWQRVTYRSFHGMEPMYRVKLFRTFFWVKVWAVLHVGPWDQIDIYRRHGDEYVHPLARP